VPRLRLSLTISGAVRVGAFEGGALAALVVASRALGEETLVIDSIASASVGSINDLLTARSLLGGVDPVSLFGAAWVGNGGVENGGAESGGQSWSARTTIALGAGPLGPHGLPSGPVAARQSEPVRLSMALSNLENLIGERPGPDHVPESTGGTVLDWYSVELTSAATPSDFRALVHAAGMSGCAECVDTPAPDNRPLGRTIDLVEDIASDDQRLYLVVDPDPTLPSLTASVYDDLTRLERAGAHIEWIEQAGGARALDVLRRQGDVVAEARRIMTERGADRSDDYAALLEELVHSAPHPGNQRDERHCTVESRQTQFGQGYRTMTSWLERRLPASLPRLDLSIVLDRVNREYEQLDERSFPPETPSWSAQSFSGMAALGH
jgi:hypothetical protein